MTELLAYLEDVGQSGIYIAVAVFLRVGAAMAVLPVLGEQLVPPRIRLIVTLAFVAIVAPAVSPGMQAVFGAKAPPLSAFGAEILSGLFLGVLIRLIVHALQIAGAIAAQSTSLAQLFGASNIEAQPAIGHLLFFAGLTLAIIAGLHVHLAAALISSYDVFPAGQLPHPSDLATLGVERVAQAFALAFTLSAPFVLASLVYNVALGVINRAMPQMMVAFVGAPAITFGGLLLLLLSAPMLLTIWHSALEGILANPIGSIR